MHRAAYVLYLLFCISFFLRLPSRFELLGALRLDFLLMAAVTAFSVLSIAEWRQRGAGSNASIRALTALIAFMVLSLPFVQWPGSVIHSNSLDYLKALMFFYFSVVTLTTSGRLRAFIAVFVVCQIVRVLEPLYLNATEGYWGSFTDMGGGEVLQRLAGSPYDTINPNGLAFVIVSILPFLYFLAARGSVRLRLAALALAPPLLYALLLTASRTGMVALVAILLGIFLKSRYKMTILIAAALAVATIYPSLSDLQRDRYFSITLSGERGVETARGRIEGTIQDFKVAMKRPLFGHGLGTSAEANYHATGVAQISHNLYAEVTQELGVIGLLIFLVYIKTLITNFNVALRRLREQEGPPFLLNLTHAMQVWLWMNLVFSLASYGLSSYEWYLFGGLSVVLRHLAEHRDREQDAATEAEPLPVAPGFGAHSHEGAR